MNPNNYNLFDLSVQLILSFFLLKTHHRGNNGFLSYNHIVISNSILIFVLEFDQPDATIYYLCAIVFREKYSKWIWRIFRKSEKQLQYLRSLEHTIYMNCAIYIFNAHVPLTKKVYGISENLVEYTFCKLRYALK